MVPGFGLPLAALRLTSFLLKYQEKSQTFKHKERGEPSEFSKKPVQRMIQCELLLASGGLGTALDCLSSLKIPANLPNNPFFFCSAGWPF